MPARFHPVRTALLSALLLFALAGEGAAGAAAKHPVPGEGRTAAAATTAKPKAKRPPGERSPSAAHAGGKRHLSAKKRPRHRPTRAERQRRLERLEAKKTESGLRPRHALMALLGLTVLGLLVGSSRQRSGSAKAAGWRRVQARPVVLNPKVGPDPATAGLSDHTGIFAVEAQAENAKVADEIDRLTRGNTPRPSKAPTTAATAELIPALSKAKVQAPSAAPEPMPKEASPLLAPEDFRMAPAAEADIKMRRSPDLVLPGGLNRHFESLPREDLMWSAPFRTMGLGSGMVAVTNQRVLAVHERRHFRLLPPGMNAETHRYESALTALTTYEVAHTRRPSFLVAAALLFFWYPAGTILACLCIGLHFGLTRPELGLWSANARRLYPLARPDIDEALRHLRMLAAMRAQQQAGGGPPQQQAG